MTIVEVDIAGMHCEHCVNTLRAALTKVPGVDRADVAIGRASIAFYESAAGVAPLLESIRSAGFQVTAFRKRATGQTA